MKAGDGSMGTLCLLALLRMCTYRPPPPDTQTCFACVLFAKQNQDNIRVSATSAVCVLRGVRGNRDREAGEHLPPD